MQEFQRQVERHRQDMDNLSSLALTADTNSEGQVSSKMADLQTRYEGLQVLPSLRQGTLADFLPSVQQYESSRGAWQDLLCGWEEKVEQLPPPMATPKAIQMQLDQIKVGLYQFGLISNVLGLVISMILVHARECVMVILLYTFHKECRLYCHVLC